MFVSFIKRLFWPLGLLLLLTPSFSAAQSYDDSTFNGIDYYAGRVVRGFGGGFLQLVGEKEDNERPLSTAPFLYGSIGSRLGLRLSNSTSWIEFDDGFAQQGLAKNTSQFTTIQMTARPVSGAWLEANGAFTREKRESPLTYQYKYTSEIYGLRWIYLSRNGRIALTPEQLAYAYYALPDNSVLRNFFETPLRFLSPKQTMLLFSGEARQYETLLHTTNMLEPDFTEKRRSSFRNRRFASVDFLHAVNRRVMLGFTLEPFLEKSQSGESWFDPDYEFYSSSRTTSWNFAPRMDFLASSQILHRFAGNYALSHTNRSSTSGTLPNQKDKHWQFDYVFHYLRPVQPLSMEAFLADWNHVFGNRLPAGAWHLIGRASTSFTRHDNLGPQPDGPILVLSDTKSRDSEFSLTGIYGLLNWLEVGGETVYGKMRFEQINLYAITIPTQERSYRRHAFTLSFANYRYESRFKARFGWEQIREFDRLHGPLLLGGMVNSTLAIAYTSSAIAYTPSTDFLDDIRTRTWIGEALIRAGIAGNVELSLYGRLFKQSLTGSSVPTQKYFNVSLAWQPWDSIRFRIGKGNLNANPETGFLFANNEAWSLQLMSLF